MVLKSSGRHKLGPRSPHPMRLGLPDNVSIKFTHSDLHPSNISITLAGDGQARISALIDFEQSGWYPTYWKYCKAWWTAEIGGKRETMYLPRILDWHDDAYKHRGYFCLSLGI